MVDAQSITRQYRIADVVASGFPIVQSPRVRGMARPVDRTDFGTRLRDARRRAGLSQTELAQLVGMAQSTLAELEKLGHGSAKTVALAAAVGVSAEWLAGGEAHKTRTIWPFSRELYDRVGQLEPQDLKKLEDVMRAHLGMGRGTAVDMSKVPIIGGEDVEPELDAAEAAAGRQALRRNPPRPIAPTRAPQAGRRASSRK
jgi:transcriptional regulator with XRE-family HTH domain